MNDKGNLGTRLRTARSERRKAVGDDRVGTRHGLVGEDIGTVAKEMTS